MTTLPLCARPGCLYAAVTGTERCLPHTEPGKGDGSYHGVYHREGGWTLPLLATEQAAVAARPYTDEQIPIVTRRGEFSMQELADIERRLNDAVAEQPPIGEYMRGLQLDVRPRGGITENGQVTPWPPYLQPALVEAARQSAAQLAAAVERINAKAAAPPLPPGPEPDWGWLGRLLNRLFT